MIFHYKYENDCISPGIDVSSDSVFQFEKEVLLLPFTFVKFNQIEKKMITIIFLILLLLIEKKS